jgi:hypothetical protein
MTTLFFNFNMLVATDGLAGSLAWLRYSNPGDCWPAQVTYRSYRKTWTPIGLQEGAFPDYWVVWPSDSYIGYGDGCPSGCDGVELLSGPCNPFWSPIIGGSNPCTSVANSPDRYDIRTDVDRSGPIARGAVWNIRSSSIEGHVFLIDTPISADASIYDAYWHPSPLYAYSDTINPPIGTPLQQWTHLYSGSSYPSQFMSMESTSTGRRVFSPGVWINEQIAENTASFKYTPMMVGGSPATSSIGSVFTYYTGSLHPTAGCVALPNNDKALFAARFKVSGSRGYSDGSDTAYREVLSLCTHLPCILTQSLNDFTGRPDFLPVGIMSTYFRGYFGKLDNVWATGELIASGSYYQTDIQTSIRIDGPLAHPATYTQTGTAIDDEKLPSTQIITITHDLTRYRKQYTAFRARPRTRRTK